MGDDRSREREPDLDKATAKAAKTTGWGIHSGGHPRNLEGANVGGAAAAAGAADGPSDSSWGSAVKKKSRMSWVKVDGPSSVLDLISGHQSKIGPLRSVAPNHTIARRSKACLPVWAQPASYNCL